MESRHQRARDLFFESYELLDDPTFEVTPWLAKKCDGDEGLLEEVLNLIEVNLSDEKFMPEEGALQDPEAIEIVRGAVSSVNRNFPRHEDPDSIPQPNWVPPEAEVINELLDAYDVTEMVAHGGMGTVYRGRQVSLERMVAIKVLPPELGEKPSFAARFRREALSMAKLDHPNIVTIHDFGSVMPKNGEALYYIVMEYVAGADLQRLIASRELSEKAALGVVGQVCDALHYAHSQGFVHRDIKPANIFVSAEGKVKVGDFGLAKFYKPSKEDENNSQISSSYHIMGTPYYMAPESRTLYGKVDHRADIYSLGVVLYQMLTGTIPTNGFKPPSELSEVDPQLDLIVSKAMQIEPEDRFQQVTEIRTAIAQLGDKPAPKKNLASKLSRGRRVLVLAIIIAALIAMGIGGCKLW